MLGDQHPDDHMASRPAQRLLAAKGGKEPGEHPGRDRPYRLVVGCENAPGDQNAHVDSPCRHLGGFMAASDLCISPVFTEEMDTNLPHEGKT